MALGLHRRRCSFDSK